MHSNNLPIFKDIVLAGGGHAHSLLIRQWGMKPLPGVRLTLVSPDPLTPYSGMLPGLIAGHYTFEEIHIDLVRLCQWAGVRFILSTVTSIDPEGKRLSLSGRPDLAFDALSIDTGSTPAHDIPGVKEFAIPIKPISGFWQHWQTLLKRITGNTDSLVISVVGGGAGSVESILAMAWSCRNNQSLKCLPEFKLVYQGVSLLPGYPRRVQKAVENACKKLGIQLHGNFRVTAVRQNSLESEGGVGLETDHVFWCVQAGAPGWPAKSGLACNPDGFIEVDESLQSTSHPGIFAAGDIAHLTNSPIPKAGVYAVRQAPVLFANIQSFLLNTPMENYEPQNKFLSLLALGEKLATGSRGSLAFTGNWVWQCKNRIDQTFMERFKNYPELVSMSHIQGVSDALIPGNEKAEQLDPDSRCGGCGAKIGGLVLSQVLSSLITDWKPEDASIIDWPEASMVQSADLLKAPFDDPWLMGRIAVFHALNDLHAMNASPHSIQAVVTLPFAGREIQQRELTLLLEGIISACKEEGATLVGGHSGEGHDLSVCLTANGKPGVSTYRKKGANKGDFLVTNKALGTGIILAGHMLGKTKGLDLAETLALMNTSNKPSVAALNAMQVQTCTDISGFGLLGHLAEILQDTDLAVELFLDQIPVQAGIEDLVKAGVHSSLSPQNESLVQSLSWASHYKEWLLFPVLLDPQTSGGILALVPESAKTQIERAGFQIIGQIC